MRTYILAFFLLFSLASKVKLLSDSSLYFDIPIISYLFDHPTASWIVLLVVLLVELTGVLLLCYSTTKHVYYFILVTFTLSLCYSIMEFIFLGYISSYLFLMWSWASIIFRCVIIFFTYSLLYPIHIRDILQVKEVK
jgi:hypothetical protein